MLNILYPRGGFATTFCDLGHFFVNDVQNRLSKFIYFVQKEAEFFYAFGLRNRKFVLDFFSKREYNNTKVVFCPLFWLKIHFLTFSTKFSTLLK